MSQGAALAVFSLGLLLGGSLSAGVAWLLSGLAAPVPAGARTVAVLLAALLAVLRDLGLVRVPLPQNARQIPQPVLQRGVLGGGLQFGFELGTGVRTFVSASAPYAVAAALLLGRPSLPLALATGLGFGGGRAVTALLRWRSGLGFEAWDRHLGARLAWIVTGASAGILATLAILLLA